MLEEAIKFLHSVDRRWHCLHWRKENSRLVRSSQGHYRLLQEPGLSSLPAATQEHPTHSCVCETINCGLILFRKEVLSIRKVILMEDSVWGGSKRFAKNYTNTVFKYSSHLFFIFKISWSMTFALSNLWEVNLFLYSVSSNVLCVKHTDKFLRSYKSVKYFTLIRYKRDS